MENRTLTRSKALREIDKFVETVETHWEAYIFEANRKGSFTDQHDREYPVKPNFTQLCNDFEGLDLETVSDFIIDNNDVTTARTVIERKGYCHDLMKYTANYQDKTKNEKELSECRKYTALMRSLVIEIGNLERKMKLYDNNLVFAYRPQDYHDPIPEEAYWNPYPENKALDPLEKQSDDIQRVMKNAIEAGFVKKLDTGQYKWTKAKKLFLFFGYLFKWFELEEDHWKLMTELFGKEKNKHLAQEYGSSHYFMDYQAETEEEKEIQNFFIF